MSNADFRHIAFQKGPRNCERLFRAAVSAFCSLARPTRREIVQLDDLALGLFDAVSRDARRFAAATLSKCDPAPPGLVRRLAEEPVDIAAPLLVRSRALSDVDLIALIARHGLPHARAIARRDHLHPAIAALIRALVARAESAAEIAARIEEDDDPLEAIRRQLREVMREAGRSGGTPAQDPTLLYARLREAALSENAHTVVEALSAALGISAARARRLFQGTGYGDLLTGLRALELKAEEAFLLTAALFPAEVAHPAAIRLFLERYGAASPQAARERLARWREEEGQGGAAAPLHSAASTR